MNANHLLQIGIPNNVVRTTALQLSTELHGAGIINIPFVRRQADAALMNSIFWIVELDETDDSGMQRVDLAYSQLILLDFFRRFDGKLGKIRWPHISINMMEKVICCSKTKA